MLDQPSIDVMERTKPLSDPSFRLLVALETVMPPGVTQPLAIRALRAALPRKFRRMYLRLEELELHGWIRRRSNRGRPLVDLLYRREG